MNLPKPLSIPEIAKMINAQPKGDESILAHGINEIHKVRKGDITFVDHIKYYDKSLNSEATIIIIDQDADVPEGKCLLICENPFEAYDFLVKKYASNSFYSQSIDPTAQIHASVIIEPNVIIGAHVEIGENSIIRANCVIGNHSKIGKNCYVDSGVMIGSEAFYFKKNQEQYKKWTTGGKVVLEDDVFIGSASTIARGVSGDTIIGQGTKIDCQVHIGHGVVLGKNCLLAAQVGISGKTVVGDNCTIYGQVGIAQNLTIGDNTTILAKSGIAKNLDGGKTYFGYPAAEAREKYKQLATLNILSKNKDL